MYSNGYVKDYLRLRRILKKYENEFASRGMRHVIDRIRQEEEDAEHSESRD